MLGSSGAFETLENETLNRFVVCFCEDGAKVISPVCVLAGESLELDLLTADCFGDGGR
jgi:hypothetical protein